MANPSDRPPAWRTIFEQVDEDGDGFISKTDLSKVIADPKLLNTVWASMDKTNTGSVNFDMFCVGYEKLQQGSSRAPPPPPAAEDNLGVSDDEEEETKGAKGKPKKRNSLVLSLLSEEKQAAPDAAPSKNFENLKHNSTRDQRFRKILDWCDADGHSNTIQFSELEVTMRYLARPFSDEESASMMKHMKSSGFANITIGKFKHILTSIQADAEGDYAKMAKSAQPKVEWSDDRVVNSFIVKFTGVLSSSGAGAVDTSHEDQLANLKQEIANLQRIERTATQRYQKLANQASQLDQENTDLRRQLSEADLKLSRAKALESGAEGSLQSHKAMVEQFRTQKSELENQVKSLKHEAQNVQAVLQVERKMKKTHMDENKQLKDENKVLKTVRSEANRLSLKKKMGKMNAAMARRKLVVHLQGETQKIPALESEIRLLKEKNAQLEEQMQEMMRLRDSDRFSTRSKHITLDLEETPILNLATVVGDDLELEALKDRVRRLEHELKVQMERCRQLEEKNARLETENAQLTKELHEEKEKNVILTAENVKLREEIVGLKQVIDDQEKLIVKLREEIKGLEAEVARLTNLVRDLEAQIARLKEENAAKDKLIAELQKRIAELERRIADLEKELENLKRQFAAGNASTAALLEELAALRKEVADLKRLLAERDARIKELEEEIARLRAEIARLNAENKRLQEELENANKALAAAIARIAELEAEIARLKAELEEKQEEVVTIVEERTHQAAPVRPAPDAPKIVLSAEQQAEVTAYAICMNHYLGGESHLAHLMPINVETPELLVKVSDGLLLSKWMNIAVPGTIDERALNYLPENGNLSSAEILQNLNLCLSAAKSIGVTMKAPSDDVKSAERGLALGASQAQLQLMECTEPDLTIGFIFELIRSKFVPLLSCRVKKELIELKDSPEVGMSSVKLPGLVPKELGALGPDQLLLRWLNWHRLAGASAELPGLMTKFADAHDCQAYSSVLSKVSLLHGVMQTDTSKTDAQRAKYVLEQLKKMGGNHFHRAPMLTAGSERLNLLFAACIFELSTGFKSEDQDDVSSGKTVVVEGKDSPVLDSDSREERAFRMWINSAGIPNVFLNNLFMDCRDGLALLRVEDWVEHGCVNWKTVEMKPNNPFKCVTNCNLAVGVGKAAPLGFSLVSVGGEDIHTGSQKFILAICWQLMRHHTIKKLKAMRGGSGAEIKDTDILQWANGIVKGKPHPMNTTHTVLKNFRDADASTSLFLLNLIWALEPRTVDWKMVTPGESPQDKVRNAGYAIAVARKLGAEVFLLPHDIVEVKEKMMLLFIGSLMQAAASK